MVLLFPDDGGDDYDTAADDEGNGEANCQAMLAGRYRERTELEVLTSSKRAPE